MAKPASKPRKPRIYSKRATLCTVYWCSDRATLEKYITGLKVHGGKIGQQPKLIKGKWYASVKNKFAELN